MRNLFLNGPAQSSKTTVIKNIETHLAQNGETFISHDIGLHFRRITKAARNMCGASGVALPDSDVLESRVRLVMQSGVANDPDIQWGDLHTQAIDAWVATVANVPGVKADAVRGVAQVADTALERGVDALIIAGRAPYEQLVSTRWFARTGQQKTLELFTQCDPVEAGRRALVKEDKPLTPENIGAAAGRIITRRLRDENHIEFPCVEPVGAARFDTSMAVLPRAAQEAMADAYRQSDTCEPLPIIFDTSRLDLSAMYAATVALTDVAFEYAEVGSLQ